VQSGISLVSGLYALVFVVALLAALFVCLSSSLSGILKIVFVFFLVAFAGASYFLAGRSGLSPFSFRTGQTLGSSKDNILFAVTGIVGAVAGVVGSYFFRVDPNKINYRDLLRPLAFCPVTLIPVIKMVEAADDTTFLGYVLLFCLAYQTGFFWERLLKAEGS
jgi:hypothetical protein